MNNLDPDTLEKRLAEGQACIGVIGLGYVGLPLALAAANAGLKVLGFDIDEPKVLGLNAGRSPLEHIGDERVERALTAGLFEATANFARLVEADAVLICVPTPLGPHREPDLSFVEATTQAIAARLRQGQLIVLESTTFPGTTRAVVKPLLESTGLRSGREFWLAYSPEREDPGNLEFDTSRIPKLIGGDDAIALQLAATLYGRFVVKTVPVSSPEVAEAAKLTENIFRSVNIALVNELKQVFTRLGIDVFEVIRAAATKPFGYMPFWPGPGLGGHCIPIDPSYLAWKALEVGERTRFIELASEINRAMPHWVVDRLAQAVDCQTGKGLSVARLLLIGVAYKKNVDDSRESPGFVLMELLEARGAEVIYHDPHITKIPRTRGHSALAGRRSERLEVELLRSVDAVLVVTDHDNVDWGLVAREARLVVDTRDVMGRLGLAGPNIARA